MKVNKKAEYPGKDTTTRLAGGYGAMAAKQESGALLRRSVMANLLWENAAYEDGVSIADNICRLIKETEPRTVVDIAIEARTKQKLRHVPLLIAREMARLSHHKKFLGFLLPQIILRADELSEFLALYWKDKKQPIAKQVKIGLGRAFNNFDEYQLAKYNRNNEIKLRDVLFLVHARPAQGKEELFKKLANNELIIPDTWEVALSSGKDKKETWERLIKTRKLGALAFVRNLRNIEDVGVSRDVILHGFETINPEWLLPLDYLKAALVCPRYERELETLMLRGFSNIQKLPGHTIFVVDRSGSMARTISSKTNFTRLDVACAMAMLAAEMSESISVYATAGDDYKRVHDTKLVRPRRGFALINEIKEADVGGGGIFTRQCLEYIKKKETRDPDRILVFSDSQDCDYPHKKIPAPFGKNNYIIDVSANTRGINYKGVWSAEISGWSEHFLKYVAAYEGLTIPESNHNQ